MFRRFWRNRLSLFCSPYFPKRPPFPIFSFFSWQYDPGVPHSLWVLIGIHCKRVYQFTGENQQKIREGAFEGMGNGDHLDIIRAANWPCFSASFCLSVFLLWRIFLLAFAIF
jgi:hypothetical protein